MNQSNSETNILTYKNYKKNYKKEITKKLTKLIMISFQYIHRTAAVYIHANVLQNLSAWAGDRQWWGHTQNQRVSLCVLKVVPENASIALFKLK